MTQEKHILVYNKNNELIEIFSNENASTTEEAQANMLSAPTIKNAMNGECTLSFSMLASSDKWERVKNPENIWACDGKEFTPLSENSYQYADKVVNVVLKETWNLLEKEYVQAYNFVSDSEPISTHVVRILPKSPSTQKLHVGGVAYEDSAVVDSRGVVMPRGSAGYALWAVLKGNRYGWTVGVVDMIADDFDASNDIGSFNLESDKVTRLENIKTIQSLWGGVLVWDSANKTVGLRDETKENTDFNEFTGFIATEGKNLAEAPQVCINNDIVTRLYPLGNGNLSIKNVNNNVLYVDNFSYTTAIYERYVSNNNIYYTGSGDNTGEKQLKAWGEQQLTKLCKPRETYLVNIIDRSWEDAYSHETFNIGDVIKVIYSDPATGELVEKEARVLDKEYDYFGNDCSATVGDKILNNVDIFNQMYTSSKQVNDAFDASGYLNADDIYLDITEFMEEYFGDASRSTLAYANSLYAKKITESTVAIASVNVKADANSASIEAVSSFSTETSNALATFQEEATATYATISAVAAFQQETETGFTESAASIQLVSDALSAQINLEATHYSEVTDDITDLGETITTVTDSVAALRLYSDSTFAKASLLASYAKTTYVDGKIGSIGNYASIKAYADATFAEASLLASYTTKTYVDGKIGSIGNYASIKAYADATFATTSQLSVYTTYDYVGNAISTSEASVKTYADSNYASVTITAKVTTLENKTTNIDSSYGLLEATSSFARIGATSAAYVGCFSYNKSVTCLADRFDCQCSYVNLSSYVNTLALGSSATSVYIMGSKVAWSSGGYLIKA